MRPWTNIMPEMYNQMVLGGLKQVHGQVYDQLLRLFLNENFKL